VAAVAEAEVAVVAANSGRLSEFQFRLIHESPRKSVVLRLLFTVRICFMLAWRRAYFVQVAKRGA